MAKKYVQGVVFENQIKYWQDKLSDFENIQLPLDKARPTEINYAGENVYFKIELEVTKQLKS